MYFKSTFTGQIYEVNFIPMGVGWELSTKEEYIAYMKSKGFM
jgi:hypothetical protein